MKLIELLVALNRNVYVRIEAIDSALNIHTIIGDNNTKGRIKLIRKIIELECAEYTVTDVDCFWGLQELYIKCIR